MKALLRIASAAIVIFAAAMGLRALFRSEKRRVTVTTSEGDRSVTVVSGELRQNDQVVYYTVPPAKGAALARVVAFPGERVRVIAGTMEVDGSPFRPPKTKFFVSRTVHRAEISVPTGCFFLVGEEIGPDSLSHGPIPRARVAGKVIKGD